MSKKFAALILTHGRPEKVLTYKTLRKCGYTGSVYLVCDNEDKYLPEYVQKYGDQVVVFDKASYQDRFDIMDNRKIRNSVVYARNAVWDIAEQLGLDYFIELDDDYHVFAYKFDSRVKYGDWPIKNLDKVLRVMVEYMEATSMSCLAMAQNGDFIGGKHGSMAERPAMKRKSMNTFVLTPKRRFKWPGRINEDVNVYVKHGSVGKIFFQINTVAIAQMSTQQSKGGLTDIYLDSGTYVKSFYTVMIHPSSVKIGVIGTSHRRLHQRISWKETVPKLIREKWKK